MYFTCFGIDVATLSTLLSDGVVHWCTVKMSKTDCGKEWMTFNDEKVKISFAFLRIIDRLSIFLLIIFIESHAWNEWFTAWLMVCKVKLVNNIWSQLSLFSLYFPNSIIQIRLYLFRRQSCSTPGIIDGLKCVIS